MKHIKLNLILFILHYSFIICEAQRTKDIYIQVIDTAGLTASVVADTSWILGQLDIVRAELADTSELIQNLIDQQRRLFYAPYYLGQDTLGGIIYHLELDANGEVHGLIACPEISINQLLWKQGITIDTTGAISYQDGQFNTNEIISYSGDPHPAAEYCDTLTYNGFTDWYLGAVQEIKLLSQNINYVLNSDLSVNWFDSYQLINNFYIWSSSCSSASSEGYTARVSLLNAVSELRVKFDQFASGETLNEYVIPIRKF